MQPLLKSIKEHWTTWLAVGVWTFIAIPSLNWMVAFLQSEKSIAETWGLLLTILLSTCLSVLYVAKLIKEKSSCLEFRENLYWRKGDLDPFCPICRDKDGANRRLLNTSRDTDKWIKYECHTCKKNFEKSDGANRYTVHKNNHA
ncbi:Unannotated [Lentimonas sp. CC4]|nr:Unannotated [Lentimonas sp. CC4]CAA6686121.1 Unannotated [Lentimonas sp. CC6]CAA7074153.1 Unannotated [Lentimonas sp. CC4]CAA7171511.1 Unannotated [Lentimonas sp. CC21]CAA7181989.1 Unannotated [Lentimonas sp. CC8]